MRFAAAHASAVLAMVVTNMMTSRRCRRAVAAPVRQSRCFHSNPPSWGRRGGALVRTPLCGGLPRGFLDVRTAGAWGGGDRAQPRAFGDAGGGLMGRGCRQRGRAPLSACPLTSSCTHTARRTASLPPPCVARCASRKAAAAPGAQSHLGGVREARGGVWVRRPTTATRSSRTAPARASARCGRARPRPRRRRSSGSAGPRGCGRLQWFLHRLR